MSTSNTPSKTALKSAIPGKGVAQIAMNAHRNSTAVLDEILRLQQNQSDRPYGQLGYATLQEAECAAALRFELSEDLKENAELIQQAVCSLLSAPHCVILISNEQSGLYALIDDLQTPGHKVHELTGLTDPYLGKHIESHCPQAHFLLENSQVGLIAVTGRPFTQADQALLDLLAPYLAQKLSRFMRIREAQALPFVQGVVLELASRLVTAVDRDAIITAVLETLALRLGFDACQYVGFNPETGSGEVLFDIRNHGKSSKVNSYSHAGLESKRRTIQDFSNLVGLLSSMARNRFYLHLNGKKLGTRTLSDIFGLRGIQSAILLPVVDLGTGEIQGTFNLFYTNDALIGAESRKVAQEAVQLASHALSRAMVLEKAIAMASSDELTGLINRRGYYHRFEAEIERARRHQTPLSVALVDVDHFKRFNDTYGHLSGDLVLKALAELFTQNLRRSDVVCRFGGEEFAILLPDTGIQSAVELMERVRQSVEKLQLTGINGEPLTVTISVGVAEVDTQPKVSPHRSEISEALALADEQLYVAKDHGRNRVCAVKPERKSSQQAS